MLLKTVGCLFFLASGLLASSSTNFNVSPQLIESLKKKLADGQVSPEPGLGEGSNTLAEQIQFLEVQLGEQNKNLPAPSQPVTPTSVANLQPLTSSATLSQIPSQTSTASVGSSPSTTPSEADALKARIIALETRLAVVEKKLEESSSSQKVLHA